MAGEIPEDYVRDVCGFGSGPVTCSYLTLSFGPGGWGCAKNDPGVKAMVDIRRAEGTLTAMGDNCEGWAGT